MSRVSEYVINEKIAEILRKYLGIDARAERIIHRRRPDIMCYYKSFRIGIETSRSMRDAEEDAIKRLKDRMVDIAIALRIPKELEDVPEDELEAKIRSLKFDAKAFTRKEVYATLIPYIKEGRPEEWETIELKDIDILKLKILIDEAVERMVREEEIRRWIERIKEVVGIFTESLSSLDRRGEIHKRIYDILYKLYGLKVAEATDREKTIDREGVKVTFGHTALSILLSAVFYEFMRNAYPELRSLRDYAKEFGPIEGLRRALEDLRKRNYSAVIDVTIEILSTLPPNASERVKDLIDIAIQIAQERTLLRRDFAGRIYHEITGDIALRKGFATFYTEVPAAYLLATLATHILLGLDRIDLSELSEDEARKLIERIRSIKVGDFACGSGTLLTATYYLLHSLASALKLYYVEDVNLDELGRELIENNFYGIDALRYATQITAINLALMGPEGVSKPKVEPIYLGYIPKKGPWLGSLELLNNGNRVRATLLSYVKGLSGIGEEVSVEGMEGIFQTPSKFSIIIMNPPFTRATGRAKKFKGKKGLFGFIVDESARKELLRKYEEVRERIGRDLSEIAQSLIGYVPNAIELIIKGEGKLKQYLNIGQAGEGLLFLYLAYRYVDDGEVIAFVLPRGLLAGVSWFLARALLASKFHVRYIIVSSDPEGGYNFSEGTSLSETLIVARRTDSHSDDEETIFVNLLRKPRTAIDAIELGEVIKREARGLGSEISRVIEVGKSRALIVRARRRDLLGYLDNWNRFVATTDPELLNIVMNLYERGEMIVNAYRIKMPMVLLNSIIDKLGIDAREFHNLFSVTKSLTPYPILHGGGEEVKKQMKVKPNAYADPKSKRSEDVFREYSGKILLPDRIWWDTAHVIALYSEAPILADNFYVVKLSVHNDIKEYAKKTLVLWLNTTWGLLTVLTSRQETRGRWTRLKMAQWRLLPVLNVNFLDIDTLKRLAEVFDKYSSEPPGRIPGQFNPKGPDRVRLGIDIEFIKALKPDVSEDDVRRYLLELYRHVYIALRQWIGE